MKNYKGKITLIKNHRGCYILDTVKGCKICKSKSLGCYDNCYAQNIASRYDFNFREPIKRDFCKDNKQLYFNGFYDTSDIGKLICKIKNIDMPFIRIGEMGDPSEDWEHTINICKEISISKKAIVIITKHWKIINNNLLNDIKKLNITFNTSISALDNNFEIEHRLKQFERLKKYCNSILRIVSCDFNENNQEGYIRNKEQIKLFNNNKIIDTVFRPSLNNKLVKDKIINVKKIKFLKNNVWASMVDENAYLGYCNSCPDMCGII
jgi:hypothetical protein